LFRNIVYLLSLKPPRSPAFEPSTLVSPKSLVPTLTPQVSPRSLVPAPLKTCVYASLSPPPPSTLVPVPSATLASNTSPATHVLVRLRNIGDHPEQDTRWYLGHDQGIHACREDCMRDSCRPEEPHRLRQPARRLYQPMIRRRSHCIFADDQRKTYTFAYCSSPPSRCCSSHPNSNRPGSMVSGRQL